MGAHRGGNIVPEVTLEEHDQDLNAKRMALVSSATVYAVVNTGAAGNGNTTLNPSPNFIGLVSIAQPLNALVTIYPRTDFIGSMTVTTTNPGAQGMVTIFPGPNFIGLVSVAQPLSALATLYASPNFIGLVSVAQPLNSLATLLSSPNYIGLVSAVPAANVTLNPSAAYIGLVTIIPTYLSTYTSFSTVISALATLVVPPSGQRIIVKDIFVSSLGRTEMSIWAARSNATINRLPPTALSTTGGFPFNMSDSGLRWPAVDDALTVLSGSTIGIMVNLRFE